MPHQEQHAARSESALMASVMATFGPQFHHRGGAGNLGAATFADMDLQPRARLKHLPV